MYQLLEILGNHIKSFKQHDLQGFEVLTLVAILSHSTVTSNKCTTAEHRFELVAHRYQRFEFVT